MLHTGKRGWHVSHCPLKSFVPCPLTAVFPFASGPVATALPRFSTPTQRGRISTKVINKLAIRTIDERGAKMTLKNETLDNGANLRNHHLPLCLRGIKGDA
jgi:hypothetical protein